MLTAFLYTLRESLARRMGLVMIVVSFLIPAFYMYSLKVDQTSDGTYMVSMGTQKVPAAMFVKFSWFAQMNFAQTLWIFIAIFVAGALLSSYLEKGWADLLLTKGVPRWQFLLARVLGCVTLFALMMFVMIGVPGLYVGSRTGISAAPLMAAAGLLVLNFFGLVALMTLISIPVPTAALLIMVGFLQIFFSNLLVNRKELVEFLGKPWLGPPLDFLYTILPRTKEVNNLVADVLNKQEVASWAPLWWSLGLALLYLAIAAYALHRKPI